MNETEVELRKAIYGLFHVVRMNFYMKKAGKEFDMLLDESEFALAVFENAPGSQKLDEAKTSFEGMANKVRDTYGSGAISSAYNCFKSALDEECFLNSIGLSEELSAQEKSNLFSKAFNQVMPRTEKWDEDEDFYSYFIETVKEIIMPTEQMDSQAEDTCPYCNGSPKAVAREDFFGPHSGKKEGYVWGCECGAFAEMDENGRVIGKLGDTLLHQKRDLVKSAVCELCALAGMTIFESCRWFSRVSGMRICSVNDVEFLDMDTCCRLLRLFLNVKSILREKVFEYPKNRSELFLFFSDGGRLLVCNAYGFQYGRLLIPMEIGPDGIRVSGKDGMQSISISPTLQYEFNRDEMFIIHPSGKKEKFRMIPNSVRTLLFEVSEEAVHTAKAS